MVIMFGCEPDGLQLALLVAARARWWLGPASGEPDLVRTRLRLVRLIDLEMLRLSLRCGSGDPSLVQNSVVPRCSGRPATPARLLGGKWPSSAKPAASNAV